MARNIKNTGVFVKGNVNGSTIGGENSTLYSEIDNSNQELCLNIAEIKPILKEIRDELISSNLMTDEIRNKFTEVYSEASSESPNRSKLSARLDILRQSVSDISSVFNLVNKAKDFCDFPL